MPELKALQQQGYARIKVNDEVVRIDETETLPQNDVMLVVDRNEKLLLLLDR